MCVCVCVCVCVLFFMGQVQGGLWLGRYSLYGWLRCIKVPEGRLGCKYCKLGIKCHIHCIKLVAIESQYMFLIFQGINIFQFFKK